MKPQEWTKQKKIPGVDDTKEEIPEVDDSEETPGVEHDTPVNKNESDKAEVEGKSTERTSGGTNLHRQTRKEYNHKNYSNVFGIIDKRQGHGIIIMQLNSDNFGITDNKFDKADAE